MLLGRVLDGVDMNQRKHNIQHHWLTAVLAAMLMAVLLVADDMEAAQPSSELLPPFVPRGDRLLEQPERIFPIVSDVTILSESAFRQALAKSTYYAADT